MVEIMLVELVLFEKFLSDNFFFVIFNSETTILICSTKKKLIRKSG